MSPRALPRRRSRRLAPLVVVFFALAVINGAVALAESSEWLWVVAVSCVLLAVALTVVGWFEAQ